MQSSEPSTATHPAIVVLRVGVAGLMLIHGVARLLAGGVVPFGEFLSSQGFPLGIAWAWAVTLIEIVGTTLLAAGRFVVPLASYYILQLALGIALVHWSQGWFVVGLGRNGMEYSVLLAVCFVCLILAHHRRRETVDAGGEI
jgi:putative oxidoreductase